MLIGLALLAVGAALLGYVVISRQPTPAPVRPKSLAPRSRSAPPEASVDELTDPNDALVLRVHSNLSDAVLPVLTDDVALLEPSIESMAPRLAPKLVVAYEEEADEDEQTSPQARMLVSAAGDTDRGQHRKANDDSLLVLPDHCLYAVADGMGGYAGGSVASSLAVEAMRLAFEQEAFDAALRTAVAVPRRGSELAQSMVQAHRAVFSAARANPKYCKMGTTLVATRFSPNKQRVYIGHVGDSRCYRFRRGNLRQLTTDQTMGTVGLMGPHADDLLQAIGVTVDLSIDLIIDKPKSGDIYLLCSDGLNKMVSDHQIQRVLATQRDLEAAVYGLIELANDAGGRDNVTVILVKVVDRAIHEIATIPSPPPEAKGWSKQPHVAPTDTCGSDDATVIGQLPPELAALQREPTTAKLRH